MFRNNHNHNRNSAGCLFVIVGIMLFVPATIWSISSIVKSVKFNVNCDGRIKRAADANTIELAHTELTAAVDYLKAHGMTRGTTSVLWETPDTDVGFFYKNITSSIDELDKVTSETSQLERTNLLMKLRETLLDHHKDGDNVTTPSGISVFPNNALYFWSGWIVWTLVAVGIVLFICAAIPFLE